MLAHATRLVSDTSSVRRRQFDPRKVSDTSSARRGVDYRAAVANAGPATLRSIARVDAPPG